MDIRAARVTDLEEVVAIYNDAVEHSLATFDTATFNVEQRRPWFAQFDDDHPLLVADADGEVAGYAYYLPYRPKPAYAATKEVTVYVGDRWRGRGVASRLYTALIDHASSRGVHVLLAVLAGDNPASTALHRKFGFASAGHLREVGRKFGAWVDTRYFQRVLE